MNSAINIIELTLAHFPLPDEVFPHDGRFWLTLYLIGDPASYTVAKPALEEDGWKNLCSDDDFAGFSYPKKQVRNDMGQVREVLQSAIEICANSGIVVSLIDADTECDPSASSFHTLYKSS